MKADLILFTKSRNSRRHAFFEAIDACRRGIQTSWLFRPDHSVSGPVLSRPDLASMCALATIGEGEGSGSEYGPMDKDTQDPIGFLEEIFRIERRDCEREMAVGTVMASFSDCGQGSVTALEILDLSMTGMGARSPFEVAPGTRFSLHPSGTPYSSESGTVVRCIPRPDGWFELGMCYDRAIAA